MSHALPESSPARPRTIVTSSLEHEALAGVLARRAKWSRGALRVLNVKRRGREVFPLEDVLSYVRDPALDVCLVAFSHASNVTGEWLLEVCLYVHTVL